MSLGSDECFVSLGQPPFNPILSSVFVAKRERERGKPRQNLSQIFFARKCIPIVYMRKNRSQQDFLLRLPPHPAHSGQFFG